MIPKEFMKRVSLRYQYSYWCETILRTKNIMNKIALITVDLEIETRNNASINTLLIWTIEISRILSNT